VTWIDGRRTISEVSKLMNLSSFDVSKVLYGMITSELVVLKKKAETPDEDRRNEQLVDQAARIRAVAEELIGDSARKSIEKHFLSALDGIMSGSGAAAVDVMVIEFEKTSSLLRGIAVTEQLRARISQLRG